jgi:hypothetical protein
MGVGMGDFRIAEGAAAVFETALDIVVLMSVILC